MKCPIEISPIVLSSTQREETISSKVLDQAECNFFDGISVHDIRLFVSSLAISYLACKTDSEGKVVEGKHTVYRMSAAEQGEKDEWIACIR